MIKKAFETAIQRLLSFCLQFLYWSIDIATKIFAKLRDDDGRFALLSKAAIGAILGLICFSPFLLYLWALNVAVVLGAPLNYLVYAGWIVYICLLAGGGAIVAALIQGREMKEPEKGWNVDSAVKEYLESLSKTSESEDQ